jgi:ketosteroid isomerase-like protein
MRDKLGGARLDNRGVSAENIERLREAFAAFSRGELDEPLSSLTEDFIIEDRMVVETSSNARGPEALRQNLERIAEAFSEVHYDPVEFVDLEDRVLVRVDVSAHAPRMDHDLRFEVGQLWTLRGEMACRLEIYPTWADARRAAGLGS